MICIPFFHKKYNWYDIMVFNFAGCYLLQGRKCERCGKTTFRSPAIVGPLTDSTYNTSTTQNDLEKAGLWEVNKFPGEN